MNFKIIILAESQTEICLHRDRSEKGDEIVRITAFVFSSTGTEPMLERVVNFSDARSARNFVDDFSERSAKGFLAGCLEEDAVVVGRYFGERVAELC